MRSYPIFYLLFFFTTLFCCTASYSEARYHLCGSDEDGCFPDRMQYCACIPYDEINYAKPYCLDIDNLRCVPLSEKQDCSKTWIYKDQSRCLASMYQSISEPPCPTVSEKYCVENHAWICDRDGNPHNCRPT